MRKIYLTETTFINMLTEMVKEVLLLEAKMSLDDIYNKYYTDIDKETFLAAVNADPTSKRKEDNIIGIGEYTKWILKLVKQGNWKPGDSFETTDLLGKFNKHKTRLPVEQRDINKYSSVSELYNILQPYLNIQTRSEIKQEEATKVYEDEQWLIIIPHTEKAACLYGKGTKWCTAAKEDNMFDYYNEKGPLYINIHKPTNRKYQFHFESVQFMKENDRPIQLNTLPWTEGALNYYKSINKEFYFKFDWIGTFKSNGIARVELNGRLNWFDKNKNNGQGGLVWDKPIEQWFGEVDYFDKKGIARVKLNGKWNWFDKNKNNGQGGFVWDKPIEQWFDEVAYFVDGIARVELNRKQTWFSLEKQDYLFQDKWFQWVDNFDDKGIARVKLNGQWNWFSLKKQDYLCPKQWFDVVENFDSNGIAAVKLNGKWNWFSSKKQDYLCPNLWFDRVYGFNDNGSTSVELNRKFYRFTLDGQLFDINTKQPLSQEEVQELFQQQQQVSEMVNRLVKNYLK